MCISCLYVCVESLMKGMAGIGMYCHYSYVLDVLTCSACIVCIDMYCMYVFLRSGS